MAERLGDLAASKNDPVGLQLEEENLPQRLAVNKLMIEYAAQLQKIVKGTG